VCQSDVGALVERFTGTIETMEANRNAELLASLAVSNASLASLGAEKELSKRMFAQISSLIDRLHPTERARDDRDDGDVPDL
jgi:hypothetical protein